MAPAATPALGGAARRRQNRSGDPRRTRLANTPAVRPPAVGRVEEQPAAADHAAIPASAVASFPHPPPLGGVPVQGWHRPETEVALRSLAIPLARAGLVKPEDWKGHGTTPSSVLRNAWQRIIRSARRNAPDAINVHLALHPWAQLLDRLGEAPTAREEQTVCVLVDSGTCHIASMDTVAAHWGRPAARVVATALHRGLGRVINVWDPNDLAWLAEHWVECLDCYDDDPKERRFALDRIATFAKIHAAVEKLYISPRSRSELRRHLHALPAGSIRRAAAGLLTTSRAPRKLCPTRAMNRLQGDQGYPSAAVLVTKGTNDVVRHAYDEVQSSAMNSGESAGPHAAILIDTSSPARLTAGIQQFYRVLRTLAWGEHLMAAIGELQGERP
jgi:hypothetical protein